MEYVEELQIIERIKNGDRDAFETLYLGYKENLLNFIFKLVGNSQVAEDIMQETFVRALVHIKDWKPKASFKTWLFHIAVNLTRNYWRRERRNFSIEKYLDVFPSDSDNPEQEAFSTQLYERVMELINKLPYNQRVALTLLFFEKMGYDEIANILGKSLSATKTIIFRGKIYLRKNLEEFL